MKVGKAHYFVLTDTGADMFNDFGYPAPALEGLHDVYNHVNRGKIHQAVNNWQQGKQELLFKKGEPAFLEEFKGQNPFFGLLKQEVVATH